MSDKVQYLNLDEVEPSVKKVLTIKGVKHEFKQPSVGEFVNEMKRIRRLQEEFTTKDNVSQIDLAEAMVESMKASVSNAFPTIPEETLDDLTQDQLKLIREFIERQFDEENLEAEDEAGNAPAAEAESKQ